MERTETSDSSTFRVLKWIALFAACLGILFLAEYLLDLLITGALNWTLSGLAYYLVFFGGGIGVILSIVLVGILTHIVAEMISPSPRAGFRLLGMTYLLIQFMGFCSLAVVGTTWHGVGVKILFTVVVGVLFLPKLKEQDA